MPHSSHAALALEENGWLERHLTTYAHLPGHPVDRALTAVLRAVGGDRGTPLARRGLVVVPRPRVRRFPTWDVLRACAGRLRLGPVALDRLWEHGAAAFDRWTATWLRPGQDAVIGYEHSCRATFRRARRLGVRTVYNMTAAHYRVSQAAFRREAEREPGLRDDYRRHAEARDPRRNRHKDDEFAAADFVVANSRFTARSLEACGFPAERVAVVPLGAPAVAPGAATARPGGPLRFLYAGGISALKGAHYLLRAWRQAAPAAELRLAGGWQLPEEYRALPPGASYLGLLSREALSAEYLRADVLVFPTLCDGFGMVVTEAFAHGLPVLATTAAGAADLVREGENGWQVPPADADRLAAALAWCAENAERVRAMRAAAAETAARRPWGAYRRDFAAALGRLLGSP
jgi:glycosyltransferase involved in cell wall biosynthesis